jgi:glycosyltransferase involved in cell wall biosynthesis
MPTRPARILFNALAATPGGGGVSRYATELGKRLAAADERVTLLCTGAGAPLFTPLPAERKIIWSIPPLPKGRLLLEEFRLPGLANRFDLLYQPDFKLPRRVKTKAIVTAHDLFFEEFPADYSWWQRRYKVKQALRAARGVRRPASGVAEKNPRVTLVSLTNCIAEKVQKRYGLKEPPRVIPPGIDASDYPPREPAEPPFLLFTGGGDKRKNFDSVLFALLMVSGKEITARIVCLDAGVPEPQRQALRRTAEFLLRRTDDELKALYRGAAALVAPSWDEGFGLPVLEAVAAGCPVLCSDIPAFRESFSGAVRFAPRDEMFPQGFTPLALEREGDNLQISHADADGAEAPAFPMAEAIAAAMQGDFPALEPAARAAVLEKFSWEKSLAAHRVLIEEMLGSG